MPVLQPTAASPAQNEITTLLGRGSAFDGKLTFEGTVRIDGRLSGEIFSEDRLIIGEGAEVRAKIEVGTLVVEGVVDGDIRALQSVELHKPARVRGNIETPSLFIDRGVIFEGNCKMENLSAGPGTPTPTSTKGAPPIPK